ncbi:hepatoma-derived growth factor [Drosophila mojavensis]|uniref:hepatoma-derived growth factor n=1 Tax=Drosophila mojavensis TaxID=7230 RepID=UPI001CD172BC|nr:hepatoma-derived growth factor [Drosophila mojavensis]
MGRKKTKEPKQIKVGDFVFAKVRGFRAWPARVLQEDGNIYQVYFYGTCNVAKVRGSQLFDFEAHKVRFGQLKQKQYGGFREAMEHAEKSLARPREDDGYFKAKVESARNQATASTRSRKKKTDDAIVPFTHITGDSD